MWRWVGVFGALLLLPSTSLGQSAERPRLSDQGRRLIAGTVGGYWSNNHTAFERLRSADWSVDLSPSFAYFLWQRIALGAYASYARQQYRSHYQRPIYNSGPAAGLSAAESVAKFDRVSLGAQSLSEVDLAPRVGIFFWLTAGYAHERLRQRSASEGQFFTSNAHGATTQQRTAFGQPDQREHALEATFFVPLTFHLSNSVALGFGPYLQWRGYFGRGGDEPRIVDFLRVGGSSWIGASF